MVISFLGVNGQTPAKDSTASIAGRVTIGGKGVAGIALVATTSTSPLDNHTVAKATTDDDGKYQLTGLPAGQLKIMPLAKSFVVGSSGAFKEPGQSITVAEGESITKIDFALVRGGVITGRITDSDGRPVIGEKVTVASRGGAEANFTISIGVPRNMTDDRGVYRVYGLGPGNYEVSVGQAPASGGGSVFVGGSQYPKTFYPGVQEEPKATMIEINEGTEVGNIDIVAAKSGRVFSVSGRVIDADSGQPVANVYVVYSSLNEGSQQLGTFNFTGAQTDVNGAFHLEGIHAGHYAAYIMDFGQDKSSYSDQAPFDVSEGDVTGIEIKARRGVTISGVAVIENNFDQAVAALLQTVVLFASTSSKGGAPSVSQGQVGPDGSFHFSGLAPGKVYIGMGGFQAPPKGLTLERTEVDGVDQQDGIEVAAGAQITGVRLVFAYGAGSIRGEVRIEGGVLPAGLTLQLVLSSGAGDTSRFVRNVEVDARGHFLAENIPPGAYVLTLVALGPDRSAAPAFAPVTQTVSVESGQVQVVLIVNLAAKRATP